MSMPSLVRGGRVANSTVHHPSPTSPTRARRAPWSKTEFLQIQGHVGHPMHTDGIDFPPVMAFVLDKVWKKAMHHFSIARYGPVLRCEVITRQSTWCYRGRRFCQCERKRECRVMKPSAKCREAGVNGEEGRLMVRCSFYLAGPFDKERWQEIRGVRE